MRKRKTRSRKNQAQRLKVRPATLADLRKLVEQRRLMWRELGAWKKATLDQADREYSKWARGRIRNKSLLGWLVEGQDGRVLGGGTVWLKPVQPRPGLKVPLQPYLLSMFTEPAYRGRGIASLIVREASNWTRRHGYSSLALHASNMGRRVYSREGFRRTWEMRKDFSKVAHR